MADYEIQIKTSSFLAVQLARFQSIQLCPPPPLTIGGIELRLQRIEFGSNSLRHSKAVDFPVFHKVGSETQGVPVPGFQTQIDQEVVLFAATEADLLAHPNGPPANEFSIGVHAIFDLDYYALDPQCYFNMDLTDVKLGALPAELPAEVGLSEVERMVKDRIKAAVPQVHRAINFANLVSAGEIQNAGISVRSDGAVLALRAEVGTSGSGGAINARWQNFFNGAFPNRLGAAEWGWLVPGNLLEEFTKATVWGQAAAGSIPPQVQVLDVGSHYSGLGNRAHLDTTIRAEVGASGLSETVEATIGLDLTLPEPRHLRADLHLPNLDSIARKLSSVARFFVLFIAKPLLGAAELFESLLGQVEIEMPGANCWQITPLHRACDMTLPTLESGETRLRFTTLDAQPGHLLLGGRVVAPHYTPSRLESEVRGFRWELPELSCDDADLSYVAVVGELLPKSAPLLAEVALHPSGTAPAYLCSAEVIDDKLGVFPSSALRWDSWTLPTTIVLEVPNPGDEYNRDPYPVRILVTTTLGTRLIEIPAAGALTPEVIDQLTAAAIFAVGNCKLLMTPGFDLKWLIDPKFLRKNVLHHWNFAFVGLLLGSAIELSSAGGKPFASVKAMAAMPTMLSAVVVAADGESELSLQRLQDGDVDPTLSEIEIEIRQQQLEVMAAVPLHSQCLRAFKSTLWSQAGVVAVLEGGIAAFELTHAEMPLTIGRWDVEGTLGAWSGPSGIIAFNEHGFHRIDAERRICRIGPEREPSPILDATACDGVAYVLTESELELRSPEDLMPRESNPSDGAHCLLHHCSRLILGGFGITVYELDESGEITSSPVHSCPDFEFTGLELATASGEEIVLARLADGSWHHLLIDEDGRGERVASFPQAPWFAGGVPLGDRLLVLLGERRHSLLVTVPGRSHRVGAEAMVEGVRG